MSGTRSTDLPIIDDYARSYCALFELGFLNMSLKSGTKDFSYAKGPFHYPTGGRPPGAAGFGRLGAVGDAN